MKIITTLVVMDLETTGVWIEKDKIIEIALVKYDPTGARTTYHKLVNPGIPIPDEVSQLTGISNEAVKEAPPFKQIADEIQAYIGNADIAGFNIERFDLPLLKREFDECGHKFEWSSRKIYDAQKVFHLNEKRDLTAAYEFYCNSSLEEAHSALADAEAAYRILAEQIKRYGDGKEELSSLDRFEYKSLLKYYDKDKKFCWWNKNLYMTFGKYARKLSLPEIAAKDRNYLNWIANADFSGEVKSLVRDALSGKYPSEPVKK